MTVADTLRTKLENALGPLRLDVIDESHLHAGHAGARPEGETHFRLFIVSDKFDGQSRVARQRMINEALKEELADRVHALAMKTLTPSEAASLSEQQ